MLTRIRRMFAPPVFPDDEDKTRQARVLNSFLVNAMLFLAFVGCIVVPFIYAEKLINSIVIAVLFVSSLLAYGLMRRGQVRFASVVAVSSLWLVFTVYVPFAGGINSIVVVFYFLGTVIAGLLLGTRAALIHVAACCLTGLGMVMLEISGHPLPHLFQIEPMVSWVDLAVVLFLTATVMNLALRSLREALAQTRKSLEERKQAELALHESEERYQKLVSASPDGITIVGLDGVIKYASPKVLELHGGLRKEEILGKSSLEWIAPTFVDKAHNALVATLGGIYTPDREYLMLRKDGTTFWGEINADTLTDDSGQPAGLIAITRDITERKQAEQALRESEEKFRRLFESSRDFLYITNLKGKIIVFNRAASTMSGYSADELKNINIRELYYDPNERDLVIKAIQEHGYIENLEIKGKRKDGTVVDALLNSTAIKDADGNVVGLQGSIKDISERKQAEEALRVSEEKFRTMIEQASEGFALVNEDGIVIEWNQAMEHIWGYPRDEVLGQPFSEVQNRVVVPERRTPEYHEYHKKALEDAILTGQSPFFNRVSEIEIYRPDGQRVFVEQSIFPIKTERGYRIGSMTLDISERKRAEEALRESEERFSRLSAATFEGIGITDQDRIVDANPQLAVMLGYGLDELLGLNSMDMVAPDSRPLVMANLQADIDGPYEHLAVKKDGTIFPVEIRARTIPYKGRQARVAIVRDITERKQAEENLSQQNERLRVLHNIEQAILGSLELNKILKLLVQEIVAQLQVDAAAVLLLNSQKQTLDFAAGQGFRTKALRFTSLKVGTGLAGQAAQERKILFVANLTEPGNNPVLAQSVAKENFVTYFGIPLIAKDQLLGVLEIFHRSALSPDPTWLKFLETLAGQAAISIDNARLLEMTQKSLKEANALYRINQDLVETVESDQLMKNVAVLLQENFGYYYVQIFIADPETGDFVVHAGSGEIGEQLKSSGYRLAVGEGIVGLTAETGKPFFTNDVDNVISFVRAPFLPDTKSELAVPIKTGTRFLGLLDIHQKPPAVLTERDVQLVSAVADQLAVALQKAQLYADLQDSLRQEQAARSQLIQAEKLAVAGRLLASVSHELNNPLQAIQNALFLLQEEGRLSKQGRQDMKIILSETERMATLLDRLRTTYQPARAEDFRPVQFNTIVEDVHALVATHLRHAHISFKFHPDPDLPSFPGLENQLRQVMLNLFMNAVDAMAGGGKLLASTRWLVEKREILVTVTDTGTGINETVLPDIFEAFITSKAEGTGLGLAISYEIVLKHGGRIQADNNPEGGATFSIWLPVEKGGLQ